MPSRRLERRWLRRPCPFLLVLAAAAVSTCASAWGETAGKVEAAAARAIAAAEDARRWDGVLKRHLADSEPAARARAALATGRLQDSSAIEALQPLLDDSSPEVRREAVFALGQIGHRSARPALDAKLRDPDAEVVQLAIEALGKLGDRGATPEVVRFLEHASPALRGEAAVALWRLADSTALQPLLARHRDPEPEVRWRVLYALEKIVSPASVTLIAAHHLEDPDWMVRAQAARTLGRQKSPRAVAYLLQALRDPEVGVVVNAMRALQLIADSTCVRCGPALAARLTHQHPYVRAAAATALADRFAVAAADSARRSAVAETLAAHLADPDPATRAACARALAAVRGEAALPLIAPLLRDSSIYVRAGALQALRAPRGLGGLLEELRQRLAPSAPLLERMTAAEVLGARKEPGAAAWLRPALRDTSALFVAAAASALAEMRDSTSVRGLARAYAAHAADADADARIALRDALRDLAGRAFADSLERAYPARPAAMGAIDLAELPAARGAVLHTSRGMIEWSFFGHEAPRTVRNFVALAKRGYFDGNAFHRVVPNFVIQDGDPTGTGSGGPGYSIRCEYNRLHYGPGMVGMALSGKDTGGSQWFITHSPQLHLDGRYTIFARVTRGMEVVHQIVQGDRVLNVEIVE